ncbi:hypothetical protein ABPG77_001139 [Micractinium sp. CCAP 211/92]
MATAEPIAGNKRKMGKTIGDGPPLAGTHSGSFHCDEALGCFLLQQTAKFGGADIVRSRDPEVLKGLDVIIDVGGVYDPASDRYDHHQRGFTEVFGHGFNTKLSSAGLVYKHYGREIVASAMGLPSDSPEVEAVYLAVYKNFMESIDAIDNGVNQWDSDAPPKYVNNTHLSARVGRLNPDWNQDSSEEATMRQFRAAMELTGSEFTEAVQYYAKSWLPARKHVQEALDQRKEVHPSGRIMKLNTFCPWKEHLYGLEEEMGIQGEILYCLYEDERERKWRIQAVGVAPGSFDSRKALPVPWRGLRDAELSAACGIPGGVFVHASGFIGGNDTLEGAVAMAAKALEME